MSDPRKATSAQRLRHRTIAQWRGVEDGPLIDIPARDIADVVAKVVKDLRLTDRMALDNVQNAWRSAAGEFIAKHSQPENVQRGVLTVKVAQSSVHHALMMEKPVLLRKLNEHLGKGKIKDIRFRHG